MLMTAAGTITPARVFVLGAGVAGLQAIATAKRLGAVIEAYDVRPAVKEQVQSVGAKFVELPLDTSAAEGSGGYAAAQDESFYRRQRDVLGRVVAGTDVVITTAAIPGQKSPVLITREMVTHMAPGSVIVDLAAEASSRSDKCTGCAISRHSRSSRPEAESSAAGRLKTSAGDASSPTRTPHRAHVSRGRSSPAARSAAISSVATRRPSSSACESPSAFAAR